MKVQFNDLDMGILEQMEKDTKYIVLSKDMMEEAGTITFPKREIIFYVSSHYYDLLKNEGIIK